MGNVAGTDRYGNELSGFESNMKIVSAIPMTKAASLVTPAGERVVFSEVKASLNGALNGGQTFHQYKRAY